MHGPTERERLIGRLSLARIRLQLMGPPAHDMTAGDFRRRAELEETIVALEAELEVQLAFGDLSDEPDVDTPHAVTEPELLSPADLEAMLR